MRDRTKLTDRFIWCFCLLLAVLLAWRWQRVFFMTSTGAVNSDTPLHVELALSGRDYGLSSFLIRALYALFEEHRAQTVLSLLLAANNVAFIGTLYLLVRYLLPELSKPLCLSSSELALLCGPWLLARVSGGELNPYFSSLYLSAYNGNIYHNMTVLFSRTLIPTVFLCFFRCWDRRHERIGSGDFWRLTVSMLIVTAFKPSFAFAFIPVLGVLLLIDLIRYKGRYLKNEIILGCSVIPAGIVCILQYAVLFDPSFAGEPSSIVLMRYTPMLLAAVTVMYLRSLLLPIYTLSVQGTKEKQRGKLSLLVLVDAVAILEARLLTETGYRAQHGNFLWGAIAVYPLIFAVSIGLLWRLLQETDRHSARGMLRCAVGVVLLLGHLVTGVYFLRLATTLVSYAV